jgi:DNA-binding CsgD family transcriptional regulator
VTTLATTRLAMAEELAHALSTGDRTRVESAAVWLQSTGTPAVELYTMLLGAIRTSGRFGDDYAGSPVEQARVNEVQEFLRDIISRLRPTRPASPRGQAVISQPDGPRHALGVGALYHLVEEAGLEVVPAGGTPLEHLADVVDASADPTCLFLALHEPTTLAPARAAIAEVRDRHPRIRVVVAGALAARPELLTGLGAHAVCTTLHDIVEALEQTNPLSPRERTVLACVARGLSNPSAGAELGVASATVKTHLDRVNAKLGTSDRTAAVAVALRRGWID